MAELPPTVKLSGRRRTYSREFLCAGKPLTPELAAVHDAITAEVPVPQVRAYDMRTTGRWAHEARVARQLRRQHALSRVLWPVALAVLTVLGGGVVYGLLAMVAR